MSGERCPRSGRATISHSAVTMRGKTMPLGCMVPQLAQRENLGRGDDDGG